MAYRGVGMAVAKGVPFTFAWTRDDGTDADIDSTNNKPTGFDYSHDVTSTDHRDGNSAVFAVSFDEPVHAITIRTIPIGITGANTAAKARLNGIMPDLGTFVTLADGPAYFNGTWLYKGGFSISYTPEGAAEVTMTLYRHGFDVENPTSLVTGGTF